MNKPGRMGLVLNCVDGVWLVGLCLVSWQEGDPKYEEDKLSERVEVEGKEELLKWK